MKTRPLRHALITGFDYHAQFLAKLVNAHSQNWHIHVLPTGYRHLPLAIPRVARTDALISFGGPGPNAFLRALCRAYKIPVAVIWAGTDVLEALDRPHAMSMLRQNRMTHFAVAPWLRDELRTIGIEAPFLPVAGMEPCTSAPPFPTRFSVLTYLPDRRRDFYGRKAVYALAQELRDLRFVVIGSGERDPDAPPNVEFLGQLSNANTAIDDAVVLLRLPDHDGMSMMVLEAMARGRHVIWIHDVPGAFVAHSPAAAGAMLRALADEHHAETLEPNVAGMNWVSAHFSKTVVAEGVERTLDALAPGVEEPRGARTVAISGLDFFVAELFGGQQAATGWTHRLLQFSSRFERLSSLVSLVRSDVWYTVGTARNGRACEAVARFLRKPRVMHWVGSDIEVLRSDPALVSHLSKPHVVHLAEADWTARELAHIGLRARIAPLPPRLIVRGALPPLPERFTVLLYVPLVRKNFYGARDYERLIAALADAPIRFLIVGGGKLDVAPHADVENLGWRSSLDEVYPRCTVLLRNTVRDGLSLMVLEALSFGRYVLWPHRFPYVDTVFGYNQIEARVRALLELHARGRLQPQRDASSFVNERYERSACIRRIATVWDELLPLDESMANAHA
ncbi:MAG: glycosyltransferase [Candidatus Eremiobacteraeota bacterium]|nr:glycosyltransferase [Candidatus Eremiobacteraeota bacterium]